MALEPVTRRPGVFVANQTLGPAQCSARHSVPPYLASTWYSLARPSRSRVAHQSASRDPMASIFRKAALAAKQISKHKNIHGIISTATGAGNAHAESDSDPEYAAALLKFQQYEAGAKALRSHLVAYRQELFAALIEIGHSSDALRQIATRAEAAAVEVAAKQRAAAVGLQQALHSELCEPLDVMVLSMVSEEIEEMILTNKLIDARAEAHLDEKHYSDKVTKLRANKESAANEEKIMRNTEKQAAAHEKLTAATAQVNQAFSAHDALRRKLISERVRDLTRAQAETFAALEGAVSGAAAVPDDDAAPHLETTNPYRSRKATMSERASSFMKRKGKNTADDGSDDNDAFNDNPEPAAVPPSPGAAAEESKSAGADMVSQARTSLLRASSIVAHRSLAAGSVATELRDGEYEKAYARFVSLERAINKLKKSYVGFSRELSVAFQSALRIASTFVEISREGDDAEVVSALEKLRVTSEEECELAASLIVDSLASQVIRVIDGRLSAFPAVRDAATTRQKLELEASHYAAKNSSLRGDEKATDEKKQRTLEKLQVAMQALTSQTQALQATLAECEDMRTQLVVYLASSTDDAQVVFYSRIRAEHSKLVGGDGATPPPAAPAEKKKVAPPPPPPPPPLAAPALVDLGKEEAAVGADDQSAAAVAAPAEAPVEPTAASEAPAEAPAEAPPAEAPAEATPKPPPPPGKPKTIDLVAVFDFAAAEENDLGFTKGDIIRCDAAAYNDAGEGGWVTGTIGDRSGDFPSNYAKVREE